MLNVVQDAACRAARFRRYSRWALGVAWGLTVFSVVAIAATVYGYYIYRLELRFSVILVSVVFFAAPTITAFWVYEMCVSTSVKYSNRALRTRNAVLQERARRLEISQCPDQGCSHCRKAILNRRADILMAAWDAKHKAPDGG